MKKTVKFTIRSNKRNVKYVGDIVEYNIVYISTNFKKIKAIFDECNLIITEYDINNDDTRLDVTVSGRRKDIARLVPLFVEQAGCHYSISVR